MMYHIKFHQDVSHVQQVHIAQKKETDQAINVISPSKQLMQKQSTHHKATSSHKKSKKVKKAIKYFNGKDVSKAEIEKALQTENFTKEEIEIVLSNV